MKKMPKWSVALALLVGMLAASSAGAMEQYFTFSFSGSGIDGKGAPVSESGSGVLGGISIGKGAYFINHVAAIANGQSLSLLPTTTLYTGSCQAPCYSDTLFSASDAVGGYIFDDAINMSGTGLYLDTYGLGLKTSSGNYINLLGVGNASTYYYIDDLLTASNPKNIPSVQVTVVIAPLTPSAAISSLDASAQSVGVGGSATNNLLAANAYFAAGDLRAACEAMSDFVGAVREQADERLARTLATALAAQARIITSSMGCHRG